MRKVKKISNDQELIQADPTSCPQTCLYIVPYANNKAADQPAHPISAFVVRLLDSLIPVLAKSKIKRLSNDQELIQSDLTSCSKLQLVSVAEQATESYLVANPEDRFSRDVAQNKERFIRETDEVVGHLMIIKR